MPEGDTLYQLAHRMDDALAGRVLVGCDIRVPSFATLDLTGETVHGVVSRGKHLLIRVGGLTIHSHLKMEGAWELYRPGARWRKPAHEARIVLSTAGVVAIGFKLGILEVIDRAREQDVLGFLGPDLLGPDWDPAEAIRRLESDPGRPIAVALLDQRNLAGVGNEYANEICFLRGMLPTRPVGEAGLPQTVDLARRLLVANRDRSIRTTTGNLRRGETTWVYRRAGQPCRRCGAIVQTSELGRSPLELRTTFFCPRCQT